MLLTIDIGNTSVKLSLFDGDKELDFAVVDSPVENCRSMLLQFIYKANLREDVIDRAILSCVVPSAYEKMYDALESVVGEGNIIDIVPEMDYGLTLDIPEAESLGDDLLVMCSYAYSLYHREMIVISMGTCTVLNHVTEDGKYQHCIIAPGFTKISETLWKNAALLPTFDTKKSDSFLPNNTVDAMNTGIYNGYIGMLRYLINGMKKQIGKDVYIIGCGGLGKMVVNDIPEINEYEPDLVTKGLQYIYKRYFND
ncbi:MAG: type III pantothenate kinase [Erysipelotrichaceae bacterium]|nr:type III pantothenate kinase [Erysipelotrichaceae bacterium]